MRFLTIIALALFSFTTSAHAKLVSYPGGMTVMTKNDFMSNSAYAFYSPTCKYSFGPGLELFREKNATVYTANANFLVRRWNAPESQGNLYLYGAGGMAATSDREEGAVYAGLSFDWETEQIYVRYENRFFYAGQIQQAISQMARVGMAPSGGNYDKINPWLMLQVDWVTTGSDRFVITPLLRLFNKNTLVELGYSTAGTFLFNAVFRW